MMVCYNVNQSPYREVKSLIQSATVSVEAKYYNLLQETLKPAFPRLF